ncbi:cobaltochelatase subunit CobN, partial [Actinosynnema sp. NPDC023658]|uniref:cobaltochelatase subunit CobN n=1 Tax=Actinosynnema sp. NPDC023658 TaxID=3155465 RepID=UPI0033EE38BA
MCGEVGLADAHLGSQHHLHADHRPEGLVRHGQRDGVDHGGVGQQRGLDLVRVDLLAAHVDRAVVAGFEVEVAVAVEPAAVAHRGEPVYPFLVNDPGEGTQAKRRAHATLVDH